MSEQYLGDYAANGAVNLKFNTTQNGIPASLLGTPSVAVYRGGSLVPITAGVVLSVDYNGVTGLNNVAIDLSASISFSVAHDYAIVLTAGTVAGVSVIGLILAQFSIQNRALDASSLMSQALSAESYAALGAVPTLSQALFMLLSMVGQFAIAGTTITGKKLDGSSTSMTFTLNDAVNPTSRVRAS